MGDEKLCCFFQLGNPVDERIAFNDIDLVDTRRHLNNSYQVLINISRLATDYLSDYDG